MRTEMKKIIFATLITVFGLSSCDFLDVKPKDKLDPDQYFRDEQDLKLFSNSFYDNLFDKTPYDEQSDIIFQKGTISDELLGGTAREVPSNAASGGWSWGQLRKINTMLGRISQCKDEAAVIEYTALAKFFRAKFYFEKVKRFGDVPWYDTELASNDPSLYKPRDDREFILGKMIEDIDEAIAGLPEEVSTYRVNKWSALMLKAQFCLYEGTFRKYHNITKEGRSVEDYLNLAWQAAEQVMKSGKYSLAADYGLLFREPDADPKEFILAIRNDRSVSVMHNATGYVMMNTGGNPGFSKKFVDSFLMKDGSRFTDKDGWETMGFVEEMKNRDPRLGMIMRLPSYIRKNSKNLWKGPNVPMTSTGFQLDKYVMDPQYEEAERVNMSFNDIPVFRFAEAYLIFAEAKAELGTITQEDLDNSVNKLRSRAGMPDMKIDVTVDPFLISDKYGYTNLAALNPSNLAILLEIRRERTIELVIESSKRWDDIVRWKEGKCYEQPLWGIYFPGPGEYDLTGDDVPDICLYNTSKAPGSDSNITYVQIQEIEIDGNHVAYSDGIVLSEGSKGYVDMHRLKTRSFDENRDYLYPIPKGDIDLNRNLAQNPGWKYGESSSTDSGEGNGK